MLLWGNIRFWIGFLLQMNAFKESYTESDLQVGYWERCMIMLIDRMEVEQLDESL